MVEVQIGWSTINTKVLGSISISQPDSHGGDPSVGVNRKHSRKFSSLLLVAE